MLSVGALYSVLGGCIVCRGFVYSSDVSPAPNFEILLVKLEDKASLAILYEGLLSLSLHSPLEAWVSRVLAGCYRVPPGCLLSASWLPSGPL